MKVRVNCMILPLVRPQKHCNLPNMVGFGDSTNIQRSPNLVNIDFLLVICQTCASNASDVLRTLSAATVAVTNDGLYASDFHHDRKPKEKEVRDSLNVHRALLTYFAGRHHQTRSKAVPQSLV